MDEPGFTAFLVDDDRGVLKAVSRLLRAAGYDTKSFLCAQHFLSSHDPAEPGCAIIDLAMSGLDGLQLQEKLVDIGAERPVIFLTGNGDITTTVKAMRAGAIDFLTKPVQKDALLSALARAIEVDASSRQRRTESDSVEARLSKLTRREREVIAHVIAGRLNKQIAASLGTVEKTIKVHRSRMMAKLGVRCVADLVRFAQRAGIAPVNIEA